MKQIHATTQLITGPASEPVTVPEAKLYCRQDLSDDDTLFQSLITGARTYLENEMNRKLINQTWQLNMDAFPTNHFGFDTVMSDRADFGYPVSPKFSSIYIPTPPTQSISFVKYIDINGTLQTLSSSVWLFDNRWNYGYSRVSLAYNQYWPVFQYIMNAVQIQYVAGYGADATFVPEDIKTAIKMLVFHWYSNRIPVVEAQTYRIPDTVEAIVSMNRVADF